MTKPTLKTVSAIILLLSLTLIFFWKILLTNLILVGVDSFLYFYPYKAYAAEALRAGRLPLWNPHLFMGAPFLANSQAGIFYPFNWLFIGLSAPKQVAWSIGLHIFLAGIFMMTYTRRSLGLGWSGAITAATLFACGGYLGAQVEHINQLNAAIWLPLLFLLYDHAIDQPGQRRRWLVALAFVIALTLLAGHTQTVFISLFGLGLYALWRGVGEAGIFHSSSATTAPVAEQSGIRYLQFIVRALWPLAVAAVLGAALAAIQLFPTAELSSLSIRSAGLTYQNVVSFSLRPTLLHYALLPPFNLDLSQPMGPAFGEWVAYVGISGLLLAGLGLVQAIRQAAPRRFVWLGGVGLLLSFGMFTGPLYLVLYYLMPGFSLFRVPARWLLLYAFGMAILAGFGLDALTRPQTLRTDLITTQRWLTAKTWRLTLFIGMPLLGLTALIAWKTPPTLTLVGWLVAGIMSASLIMITIARPTRFMSLAITALLIMLTVELWLGAQSLNYNQPTASQAFSSMRNAPAFLLGAEPPDQQPGPPGRFLSLSGITYDPGDQADLQQIFADSLSPAALYNLIVAAKQKEVLFFNLPLIYGLHSVDGYDGGILPLNRFIALQEIFLPPDNLSLDGRLREKLKFVPPGRLLSMLNTRWIITDKQFDVWIDNIFYDLQFPARLTDGQTVTATDIPRFPVTALGVVSHLENAAVLPNNTPVAALTITFDDSTTKTITLTAGRDTAEGNYPPDAGHQPVKIGVHWPYEADGVDYITILPLDSTRNITHLSLTGVLPQGKFVLRGLSLIHQPTQTSRSILLTTEGHYRQVHSGDVKIYENLDVLPRAWLMHEAQQVTDNAEAVAVIQNPNFNPAHTLVKTARPGEPVERLTLGQPSPEDSAIITAYTPERVVIDVNLPSPGWLVLTDSYYPGWQATVDDQPVEIEPVNLMFRAVQVPAGQHTVQFNYAPRSLKIGGLISALAGLVAIISLKFK